LQQNLKIQTAIPEAVTTYKTVIQFLKEQPNAKFHTYKIQVDKPLIIVLKE